MISSAIYDRLSNNTELTNKLAIMEGIPAIYKVWALQDSLFPYLVYRLEENKSFEHPYKSEFTLYIDLWDFNENTMKESGIISDIIKLEFNNKFMEHPKYGAMQSWLFSRGQMQSDLPGIAHIVHQITIHAWDKEI